MGSAISYSRFNQDHTAGVNSDMLGSKQSLTCISWSLGKTPTNLNDYTNIWQIVQGAFVDNVVIVGGTKMVIPRDANFVVVRLDGRFIRWESTWESWLRGY